MLCKVAHDVVAILCKDRGQVHGGGFEAIPIALADPGADGIAMEAEHAGYLCFGELCLGVEVEGLFFLVHSLDFDLPADRQVRRIIGWPR